MTEESNPYTLTQKTNDSPDRKYFSSTYTAEEQAMRLINYIEISPEFWCNIKYLTHVRYYTKDGEFRMGGFVNRNPVDYKSTETNEDMRSMHLKNTLYKNGTSWSIDYKKTARIFVKASPEVLEMNKNLDIAIRELNKNIQKISNYIRDKLH